VGDVYHQWGSDMGVNSNGDLAVATNAIVGQQRILRRLLTSPGDYIWQLGYGAGLAAFVGRAASPLQIRALVRSQLFMEPAVAHSPEPSVDVVLSPGGISGSVYVHISYLDSQLGETQVLRFSVAA